MDKSYISLEGYNRLKSELEELVKRERPAVVAAVALAASNGDRSENADYIYGKKRLREIDSKTHRLLKKIETLTPVDLSAERPADKVFFGYVVEAVDANDPAAKPVRFQIVGADEIDSKLLRFSINAPLPRACLGKKEGDEVQANGKTWIIEAIHNPRRLADCSGPGAFMPG